MALPDMTDLEPLGPAVYDQGNLGSCTANASSGLCEFVMKKTGYTWFTPSRLALYYWTRVIENSVNYDAGASIQDAVAVCHGNGVPHESMWWYNVNKFAVKPNAGVVADAAKYKTSQPLAINHFSLNDMQSCITQGFPFAFGFTICDGFEKGNWSNTTGMMPMPKVGEKVIGGHAVLAVGYDNKKQAFKIRNSWGIKWGLKGHFWMPYSFIMSHDFADDFWTIHSYDVWPK